MSRSRTSTMRGASRSTRKRDSSTCSRLTTRSRQPSRAASACRAISTSSPGRCCWTTTTRACHYLKLHESMQFDDSSRLLAHQLVDRLCGRVGYAAEAEGTAVSGGSAANLTGLLAARAHWLASPRRGRPYVLCSADAHYSVARAAAIMGFGSADVVKVPTDEQHRMDAASLAAALAGLDGPPLAIVATSRSTATGAFDDLRAMAALRDRHATLLHGDAAHRASVLVSDRLRPLVDRLYLADSLSCDPP